MDYVEIKDPVHNYIRLSKNEMEIVDTLFFQRLRNIKQLAAAYLVYPGAVHTRFDHSLGTFHLADRTASQLLEKNVLSKEEMELVKVCALLHDIGHGPFSHVFEEALKSVLAKGHEELTLWIIKQSSLRELIEDLGFQLKEVVSVLKGEGIPGKIIKGVIDVDKMDYLVRDSYFTGVEYGKIDIYRLIYSLEVLNEGLAIDYGGLSALEAFLIARFEMFKNVYYHKTVRSAELLLSNSMKLASDYLGLDQLTEPLNYLRLDDVFVFEKLRQLRNINPVDENLKRAKYFFEMLVQRRLFKVAFERMLQPEEDLLTRIITNEEVKRSIELEIAEEAGVDKEFVIIDTPTLPSIPYQVKEERLTHFPVVKRVKGEVEFLGLISEFSEFVNLLKRHFDVIRIYTTKEFKEKVSKEALKVLGSSFSF